jgi:glutathione S-transferase
MIELVHFPWSPYCIVQRRILEYSGARFKLVSIPSTDRALVWRLTRQRYYQVPILRDGRNVLFEVDDHSQVIAKYLDDKLQLGLFPREWEGVQSLVWRHIETEVEGATFRLNDIYWREFVPVRERLAYLRHKERKFGRGCLETWKAQEKQLLQELAARLLPFEEMLIDKSFLLEQRPRFVDFDLFGMLGNFLYSGHYSLPAAHSQLRAWHERMTALKLPAAAKEKSPS